MSLIFRRGGAEDIPGAARVAAHSFPGVLRTLPEWEQAFAEGPRADPDALWVGEEEGRLMAVCQLYPLRQWIAGEAIPITGVGTVAISPTHRRRGIGGRLTASGLRHGLERGDVASALFPFRTAFYQKLGYGVAGEAHQFHIPPAALPAHPERAGVRLVASDADRAAVRAVYDEWAPGQTGQLAREERGWEPVWGGRSRHTILYEGESGQPAGYAVFRYPEGLAGEGRAVEFEEIAWLDGPAHRGLLGWMATLGDQWERIVYRAHPDEGFAEQLAELRNPSDSGPRWHFWFPTAAILHGPMFRILDLDRISQLRRVGEASPCTVALRVADDQLPENAGDWILQLAEGRIEARKASSGNADARLELGIETLSRIFIGALSPSRAVAAGVARIDRPELLERLDALFQLPKPWTFDRF